MSQANDDFYVGYLPKAPAGYTRLLRPVIVTLIFVPTLIGVVMAVSQGPFAPAVFEFGHYRSFTGIIQEKPYPYLMVRREGLVGESQPFSGYYLVAPGKNGANDLVAGMHGKQVKLEGTLIHRSDQTMLELKPDSLSVLGEDATVADIESLGSVTLVGEIVDSKCFLGVMNPGNLKTHRACAINCIAGGIPPLLLVRDEENMARYLLLVGRDGRTLNQEILDVVADPLRVTGELQRHGALWVLKTEPKEFERL